jgi:polyvinyl alcohol dehydrogenase (cytochrome)
MRPFVVVAVLSLAAWPAAAAAQDGAAIYASHCASCHDPASGVRAPAPDALAALSPDRIVNALEGGVMRDQGAALTPAERRAVAVFLSTAGPAAPAASSAGTACDTTARLTGSREGEWNGWGATLSNDRFQREPGFAAADIPRLALRWAFGFDGEASAAVQPVIVGSRVFVASGSGVMYSLGLDDGCLDWTFKADGGVRNGPTVGEAGAAGLGLFFGDLRATVYALDPATGTLRWKRKLDEHRAARISGSPVLYNGRIYVGVSSGEEASAMSPAYGCCTFRGSVAVLDAATGAVVWQTYMIADEPTPQGKNAQGTQLWGPAGAAVWSSPTIDPATGSIYVATGDAYTQPAPPTSDAVVALDLSTGAIKWVRQVTAGDAFTMACGGANPANCPDPSGPDFDFGQPPILVPLPNGRRALVLGQKSGVAHGIDPDDRGKLLWSTRVGKGGSLGGSEWGSASDGTNLYVAISDVVVANERTRGPRGLDPKAGGGLHAVGVADGHVVWSAAPPVCGDRPNCSPAQSAPVSVVPGAVFSGSLDGVLRAYSTVDGSVLWSFDTARQFDTVNGVAASGGSIDVGGPAIAHGFVLTTSGNGTWGGRRGNVLLAFAPGAR